MTVSGLTSLWRYTFFILLIICVEKMQTIYKNLDFIRILRLEIFQKRKRYEQIESGIIQVRFFQCTNVVQ